MLYEATYNLFYQKHQNQSKIVDISTLPPCKRVLFLHVQHTDYMASIWKKANVAKPVLPLFTDHGWNEDGSFTWTSEIFAEEVEEILFDDEFDTNDYIDGSWENDNK